MLGLYFSKALFEGLIFGGDYTQWEICVKIYWVSLDGRQIRKKLSVTEQFLVCFTLYLREVSKNKPSGAYTWRGNLAEGVFASQVLRYLSYCFFFYPVGSVSCLSIGRLCGRSQVQNPGQTITQSLKITE